METYKPCFNCVALTLSWGACGLKEEEKVKLTGKEQERRKLGGSGKRHSFCEIHCRGQVHRGIDTEIESYCAQSQT